MTNNLQFEAVYEKGVLRPLGPEIRASMIDDALVAYAQREVASMKEIPSLEEIRRQLSSIKGSMAEVIISERGDY